MTQKDRFLRTLLGDGADRFPFFDLEPADETVQQWRRQGLPRGTSVSEHFELEPHHAVGVEIRSAPFYRKAADLLEGDEAFQRHYDLDDPDRFPEGWVQQCQRAHREGRVVFVNASGGGLLQMLGVGDWETLVAACRALIERPCYVEQLMEKTTDFYCEVLGRVLSMVTVDYASLYEPIASNVGLVVSPEMFRRYAIPGYRKVLGLLARHGVELRIMCTTGGDLTALLPPLIDAGINGLWISNIMDTKMHYSKLRQRFGSDIALIGGIDSRAMSRDDKAVREAVETTVPPALEKGHYLPCLDDRPRSNMPFSRYAYYRELLAEIARRG